MTVRHRSCKWIMVSGASDDLHSSQTHFRSSASAARTASAQSDAARSRHTAGVVPRRTDNSGTIIAPSVSRSISTPLTPAIALLLGQRGEGLVETVNNASPADIGAHTITCVLRRLHHPEQEREEARDHLLLPHVREAEVFIREHPTRADPPQPLQRARHRPPPGGGR